MRYLFLILTLTSGLLSAQSYGFLRWTVAEGLPANEVTSLAQDATGFLWLTTIDGRVARFDGKLFEVNGPDEGLPAGTGRLTSAGEQLLMESPDGYFRYEAATDRFLSLGADAGAGEVATKRKVQLAAAALLFPGPGQVTASLRLSAQRETLIGTKVDGLYLLDRNGTIKARYQAPDDLPANQINDLLADNQGRFWIATAAGLARMIPTGLAHYTRADGLAGRRVTAIGDGFTPNVAPYRYVNQEGKTAFTSGILFGFGREGVQFSDGHTFSKLPINDPTLGVNIIGITVDRDNRAYVSTDGGGITVITDTLAVECLTSRAGMPDDRLLTVLTEKSRGDSVWAVSYDQGVAAIRFQINLNVNGQPDYARAYGRAEGFPGDIPTPGAVLYSETGGGGGEKTVRYFGTSNGLIKYMPDGTDGYLSPPATVMTGIQLFYQPLQPADYRPLSDATPELPAKNNHLNFRYCAVDLTHPDRVRYQTRLRGAESDWQPLTGEAGIRYAGLAPGGYTFLARATTDGGKTWGAPAEYVFRIASPPWRQTWFQALMTLLAVALLVGGFYGFYRRILAGESRKRRELEAKNQLLSLEQKALQLQMNPHFIFNALNGIRGLVDGEHGAKARQQIGLFAHLMRGILNNSRREIIPLNEEIKTLTDYLEMERFC